ncbi:MAG: hypothetical protein BWY66_00230 [bacterium ADurb.Bin374]|nr:MAG: hypothetical protein BWY66_00230 [bacterium ADurb.Bin374]
MEPAARVSRQGQNRARPPSRTRPDTDRGLVQGVPAILHAVSRTERNGGNAVSDGVRPRIRPRNRDARPGSLGGNLPFSRARCRRSRETPYRPVLCLRPVEAGTGRPVSAGHQTPVQKRGGRAVAVRAGRSAAVPSAPRRAEECARGLPGLPKGDERTSRIPDLQRSPGQPAGGTPERSRRGHRGVRGAREPAAAPRTRDPFDFPAEAGRSRRRGSVVGSARTEDGRIYR